jgi:saccharopine dehydrogenase-like NADP-dependent oxidoreductase
VKILVLGGSGIQGRAAVYDLVCSQGVKRVICADARLEGLDQLKRVIDMTRVRSIEVDATKLDQLVGLFAQADAVIDLLPRHCTETVCQAAIQTGVGVVNTNYAYSISHLDRQAQQAQVTIMPECGLDPGIDLILYGEACRRFDELHLINSYCGGFPEAAACDNPLNYKISWIWEGVLSSSKRDSRMIKDGKVIDIPAAHQHDPDNVHQIDFPGLGQLEAIPNGDAVFFTDLLKVTLTIKETGRFALRWPGWSAFWHPLKQLGFLDEEPVDGLPGEVSPYQLVDKLMEPQLQYREDEKDLVAMVNVFEGMLGPRRTRLTMRMLIERDLKTGLLAMSQGVGFPASIVAQMIAKGDISAKGVLSPAVHVPCSLFIEQLALRGITFEEEKQELV